MTSWSGVMRFVLSLLLICGFLVQPNQAYAEVCPTYNFQNLFFEEYYPGTKWDTRNGSRNITWSANATVIKDETVTRVFTPDELQWIRSAFQSWDDALDTVKFSEVYLSAQAEIVIGYVALNQPSAVGYWNAWWTSNLRYKATIKLKESRTDLFVVKNIFIRIVQHELGNVLGLGDLRSTSEFESVQKDPIDIPVRSILLSDFDTGMIRQLYGESTCPSSFSTASAKAAAELKAKQEAEAKAAAEKLIADAKAEAERIVAAEKLIADAKAAADKLAAEKLIADAKAEAERIVAVAAAEKLIADAKAEAERILAVAAAEKLIADAKAEAERILAAAKAAATKKTTITCTKDKLIKKITAVKPKCPAGYKVKK